jgi:hypothetical protein
VRVHVDDFDAAAAHDNMASIWAILERRERGDSALAAHHTHSRRRAPNCP